LLYGTIVSAAALAVGARRGETAFGMDEAMVTTLIVYWLAHIYTKTVSERRPGSATPLHRLLRHSAKHESTILLGGLPAVILTTALAVAHRGGSGRRPGRGDHRGGRPGPPRAQWNGPAHELRDAHGASRRASPDAPWPRAAAAVLGTVTTVAHGAAARITLRR